MSRFGELLELLNSTGGFRVGVEVDLKDVYIAPR